MVVKHELSSSKFYKLLFYMLEGEYHGRISNLADAAENRTLRSASASQLCPIKARGLIDRLTATLLRLFHINLPHATLCLCCKTISLRRHAVFGWWLQQPPAMA